MSAVAAVTWKKEWSYQSVKGTAPRSISYLAEAELCAGNVFGRNKHDRYTQRAHMTVRQYRCLSEESGSIHGIVPRRLLSRMLQQLCTIEIFGDLDLHSILNSSNRSASCSLATSSSQIFCRSKCSYIPLPSRLFVVNQ